MDISKEILLEGIIEYTKEKKLVWEMYLENFFSKRYSSTIDLTEEKKLKIDFVLNKNNSQNSYLSIMFYFPKQNKLTNIHYISYKDIKRFDEIKKIIINE